eukprot:TRINITY_DN29609_c0_g1_i1.p1 TRINITY_DN29609_c0_g1~~TRINITY_DN29609_c0_g1_i1.p1  ORF type:complete len:448 (+),score=112.65 TRINITY_DN29609_c0_g1_i1:126-1469(+)
MSTILAESAVSSFLGAKVPFRLETSTGVVHRHYVAPRLQRLACRSKAETSREAPTSKPNTSFSTKLQTAGSFLAAAAAAAAIGLSPPLSATSAAAPLNPAIADVAVLIAGQPVKEPNALLRYALPINNKPIQDVQFPLELITEDLRVPGLKALDAVEREVRQANRVLNQNKDNILGAVAPQNRDEAEVTFDKLRSGLQEFNEIIQSKNRAGVVPKQKELLAYVGDIEEAMVAAFPYNIPEEFANMPLLKGRARVEMKIKLVDNPGLKSTTMDMVIDGYNAPVTGGNFVDLVARGFYNGMEIQRADGFVVQTGKPNGPSEGFVDPNSGSVRTIPLEFMIDGDKEPVYHETLEELGRYRATTKLPFNAFGTLAMAREEFSNDSASSQIFWLLKESELTPSNANILDGRYAVFGYIVENQEQLADVKVGDIIESMKVTQGMDNLVNPSFK